MGEERRRRNSSSEGDEGENSERKAGGWKAIVYILGNESFEKLASMSLVANITVYLRSKYNMDGIQLVNVVNIWSGSSNFTTLAGAFFSDAYLGRFLTLLIGSIASMLGMGVMTLTAGIPRLRPPPCSTDAHLNCESAQPWQLAFLYSALALLAIGSGGIRPCNIAFGADQFDTNTSKGRSQLKSFFNWWYFSFTVALLIALSIVVYIQTNVSWLLGFAIPTVCFFFSISIFLIGRHVYVYKEPQGSMFLDIIKVINAAFRKRKIDLGTLLPDDLYDPEVKESDRRYNDIPRTTRFKFLEKAAAIVDRSHELDESGAISTNTWRLCSIQQVERLKCLVGIIPVWFTGIACFISMDQMNTLGISQAMQTNTKVKQFQIPPSWIGLSSMIALSLWIFIYECIVVPVLRKTKASSKDDDVRLTTKTKIQIGIVMSILCMLVAGITERKRRQSAINNGTFASPISVAILLPQFVLSGLTEAFSAVAIMEFLNNQFPESMRSVGGSLFFLSLSASSYLDTILANVVYSITKKNGNSPWLGGHDLNADRLENFYFMIAGIGVVNFFYFHFFSCHYIFSPLVRTDESEEELKNRTTPHLQF
ncbi:protein NRT1/ PTR FAMILY 2.8-like [Impatiens glandulifera]|uniref:protein NRT1/ PTR FAMILY 2.8-like n=1 Tax=Impatiens glandulifera TaxID=253017 RepID=UPI001FB12099|nr:protein NRT1/ PTR FAMILY 2.8-like [Impatiens glandulifera]